MVASAVRAARAVLRPRVRPALVAPVARVALVALVAPDS
jgi:hypothetical protein